MEGQRKEPITIVLGFKDKGPHLHGAAAARPWVSWCGLTSGWGVGAKHGLREQFEGLLTLQPYFSGQFGPL